VRPLRELAAGATAAGIRYGGYPDIVLDLFNKRFIRRELTARAFIWPCRRLIATGRYQRWRSASKELFPQGYCLAARKIPAIPPS
jgi:hypothetical protein